MGVLEYKNEREREREKRDVQTRGFDVVGHGVEVVDEVDGEVGVVVQGATQGRRCCCTGTASRWQAGVVGEAHRGGDVEAAGQ